MALDAEPVNVRVVHVKGCQATPKAVERIKEVARAIPVPISLEEVEVTTPEEARRFRHIGSPTIQVEGVDIEPDAASVEQFGLT